MTPVLGVAAVESRPDARAFVELPYRLYRHDGCWVPPLRMAERRRWSVRHNPALSDRPCARWLARRGGRVVGRIAASYDPHFAERWAPGTGFFGFLECEDDPEAAAALFDAAHAWLRARGLDAAMGPVNLSTHDEVGLLVEGFDSPPTLLSPYNPPRYERHVREAGYRKACDYHAYRWTPDATVSRSVERLVSSARRRAGAMGRVRVRQADPRRFEEEARTLFELYNASFTDVWGFVPIAWDAFAARAAEFRPFYRPDLALIAEVDGEPAGFGLILPDINVALRHVRGRLLPFGWLQLARAVPRLRTGRFILTGVLPRFASIGLGPLLAYEMREAVRRAGIRETELSLVHEHNARIRHVIEAFGSPRTRTFRLFERPL